MPTLPFAGDVSRRSIKIVRKRPRVVTIEASDGGDDFTHPLAPGDAERTVEYSDPGATRLHRH